MPINSPIPGVPFMSLDETPNDYGRWLDKVRQTADGCWEWTGSKNRQGYGTFRYLGENRLAHRAGYEMAVGPVSDRLDLDHLCRNRGCVNPAHLEPVTHAENMRRSDPAMASLAMLHEARRTRTHCPQGHEYSSENTIRRADGSRGCRECGRVDSLRRYYARKATA